MASVITNFSIADGRRSLMSDWPDAWNEGFTAHMHGEPVESNPYERGIEAWERWADGWLDRDQHQQAKAECFPGW